MPKKKNRTVLGWEMRNNNKNPGNAHRAPLKSKIGKKKDNTNSIGQDGDPKEKTNLSNLLQTVSEM